MNAAVLEELPRSPGVWAQAWKRLQADRVGMVSLTITLLFIVLVAMAQFGLVAADWQREVGTPHAPPHFVGKITDGSETAVVEVPTGPNADLSAFDPLAPKYGEWEQRAAEFKTADSVKSDTLPLGGGPAGS